MKAIKTKYISATNLTGSRVSATTENGGRVIVGWNYALNSDANHERAARKLCEKMGDGWSGQLAMGGLPDGSVAHVFVSDYTTYEVARKAA